MLELPGGWQVRKAAHVFSQSEKAEERFASDYFFPFFPFFSGFIRLVRSKHGVGSFWNFISLQYHVYHFADGMLPSIKSL